MSRQSYVEDRVAIRRGIVRDGGGHVAALDRKIQRPLWKIGQSRDAGLAIAVGADFDFRLALAQESVLDRETNLGIENWFVRAIFHKEIRAAGTQAGVHDGNFRRIGSGRSFANKDNEDCTER